MGYEVLRLANDWHVTFVKLGRIERMKADKIHNKFLSLSNSGGALTLNTRSVILPYQDAMGWIFKISQFFDYHNTPDEECITVSSFYMDGLTLS